MATLSLLPEQELDSATNSDALFPLVARVGLPRADGIVGNMVSFF
jgi:hypothetical protein